MARRPRSRVSCHTPRGTLPAGRAPSHSALPFWKHVPRAEPSAAIAVARRRIGDLSSVKLLRWRAQRLRAAQFDDASDLRPTQRCRRDWTQDRRECDRSPSCQTNPAGIGGDDVAWATRQRIVALLGVLMLAAFASSSRIGPAAAPPVTVSAGRSSTPSPAPSATTTAKPATSGHASTPSPAPSANARATPASPGHASTPSPTSSARRQQRRQAQGLRPRPVPHRRRVRV